MNKYSFSRYYQIHESIDDLKERILNLLKHNKQMSLSEIKHSLDLPVGSHHGNPNDPVHQAIIVLAKEGKIAMPGEAWGEPIITII